LSPEDLGTFRRTKGFKALRTISRRDMFSHVRGAQKCIPPHKHPRLTEQRPRSRWYNSNTTRRTSTPGHGAAMLYII